MYGKTILFITGLLITTFLSLSADEISGKVYGIDGEKNKIILPRATVFWMDTDVGTVTGPDGSFKLKRPGGAHMIVVSYTGYKKDTLHIHDEKDLEIVLESNLTTEEVRVTADKPARIVSSSVANSEYLTDRSLKKAACCNLSESFETEPSVDVHFSDAVSGAKQIRLLGLDGVYSQILTEKAPMTRGLASAYGLTYIPGTWMESIQISKGASSVATGFESITGQINVEYKKPRTSEPFFLNLFGNSNGRIEGKINAKTDISEELSTILFFHGGTMQNEVDGNGDSFMDTPMLNSINLMNKWQYFTDDFRSQLSFKALYEDRKGGQEGYFDNDDPNLYGLNIETQRYELFGKFGYVFDTENYQSMAVFYNGTYHNQESHFGRRDYDGEQLSFNMSASYEIEIAGSGQEQNDSHITGSEAAHKFNTGVSLYYDKYDENVELTINTQDSLLDRTDIIPGAFVEYTFSGIKDFQAIAGIRADHHNEFGAFVIPRLHVKYDVTDGLTLRASGGRGFRTANIFAENTGLMASSRQIRIEEVLEPEVSWNYGANLTWELDLFEIPVTLNTEFYRTDFENQVIANLDRNPGYAYFYNLEGESYSNNFQIDAMFNPVEGLEATLAYRFIDVRTTIDGELLEKPLQSRHKAFFNAGWATPGDFNLDFTINYNGSGRLPNTDMNPGKYQLDDEFPGFVTINAQISRVFGNIEVYVGGENLTNYRQPNPILAAEDPFGTYFDSSMIWGPLLGRRFYAGVRYNLQ